MRSILFFHPCSGPRVLYLNPIEVQRLVASVANQFPDVAVDLIDQNATDDPYSLAWAINKTDVLCLSLPSGSMPLALASLPIGGRFPRPWLILFGEILSDGNPSQALGAAREAGWLSDRTVAFVGRNESQFLQIVQAVIDNVHPKGLPNVAVLNEYGDAVVDDSQSIADSVRSAMPIFTESIKEAIADRGLRVLVDGLSRGCEHRCLYCHLNNRQQTSGVVQEIVGDPDEVLGEVETWFGASTIIQFTDENFFGGSSDSARRKRLEQIHQLGLKLAQRKFTGVLGVDTRVDTVLNERDDARTRRLRESSWRAMAEAGLRYAYIGTESFSELQLKRYGKAEQLTVVTDAVAFLRHLQIQFMAGLIILDPLVTPSEIEESILYIERNNLFGNVASLLKEMRVQPRSKYYQLLEKKHSNVREAKRDMLMLTRASVPYADPTIQSVVAITRGVHELFSDSGYRHSDVAAFEALVPEISDNPGYSVPRVVTQMEVRLLRELVLQRRLPDAVWAYGLAEDCADSVLDLIAKRMSRADSIGSQKVHRYYQAVFSEIKRRAEQLRRVGATTDF